MLGTVECGASGFELAAEALDDDALITQLREAEVVRRHLEAVQAATVAELDRRRVYRRDGHASVAGLVRVVTKRPTWEVTALSHTGRLMGNEPAFADALATGRLGVAQAHLLAHARAHPRCGDALHDDLADLLDDAINTSFLSFKTKLADWVNLADADGADQRAEACHERRDAMFHFLGSEFLGRVQGGALDGTAMKEIFDRYVQAEWDKDWAWTLEHYGPDATASQMPRTVQQRRFDALAAIFEASVSTPPGAQPPEPVVNIITDEATFLETLAKYFGTEPDPQAGPAQRSRFARCCHTADGTPVAPTEMLAAALAGHIRRVVLDSASVVIDMGRKQRLFTGNTRTAAHMVIPRCIWPGCELPAPRCQTDHLTDWNHLGTTSPGNGGPCCPRHNLWKNRGYTITRDHLGHFHTYRPDGTEIA